MNEATSSPHPTSPSKVHRGRLARWLGLGLSALLVLGGLRAGDRLIVAGWKGLVAGQEVNVIVEDGVFVAAGGDEDPGTEAEGSKSVR